MIKWKSIRLMARAPATLLLLYEKGRTLPADPESVRHCDTMGSVTAGLLSTACERKFRFDPDSFMDQLFLFPSSPLKNNLLGEVVEL